MTLSMFPLWYHHTHAFVRHHNSVNFHNKLFFKTLASVTAARTLFFLKYFEFKIEFVRSEFLLKL